MPDDLTFGQLRYRLGAGPDQLRRTIARLGIAPRKSGASTLYTQEQAQLIEAEHQSKSKHLRKSPVQQ